MKAIAEAHARELKRAGQNAQVRDQSLFQSACARPLHRLNCDATATLFDIAAELAFGLARSHVVVDGNKRAAFAAAYMTLRMNGIMPDFTTREAVDVFSRLAAGTIDVAGLSLWLRESSFARGEEGDDDLKART